jgi:transcriptional regulator GlxA family with amidase domain
VNKTLSVGILLFPNVEVLDFAGPYEVFTTASRVSRRRTQNLIEPFQVFTIARDQHLVRARAGLEVNPDYTLASHPPIHLLIVPGGIVTAELEKPEIIEWIRHTSRDAQLTASVCTGSFLLAKAGLLEGKAATTHWEDTRDLRTMFPTISVVEQTRWVDEGSIVTSAGISAGIDMSLHLVRRLAGQPLAEATARQMDFQWMTSDQ